MQRSMFALAGLAVLAAVTASMFGMLAEGGGKAEATTPITITAVATGSLTPPIVACPPAVPNGDFWITPNIADPCGDGVNEFTAWTFDFRGDAGLPAFKACGTLTAAKLTLTLTRLGDVFSTDSAWIDELPVIGVSSAAWVPPISIPLGDTITASANLLPPPVSYTSAQILGALGAGGDTISGHYQDDGLISFAKLELTVDCGSGPPAVGGVVGLLGDANTPADASDSSSAGADAAPIAAAVAAAVVAMAASGWYARRRWAR